MRKLTLIVAIVAVAVVGGSGPLRAGTTPAAVYVDPKNGADAGGCGDATAPCKTLNFGLQVSPSGGTVYIVSGARFTPIHLTKPISIVGPADGSAMIQWIIGGIPGCIGGTVGSCNGGGAANSAVEIAATSADTITLTNLTITNYFGSGDAVSITGALNVTMNNVVLRGGPSTMTQVVTFQPVTGSPAQLFMSHCDVGIVSSAGGGILVQPIMGTPATVHIESSKIHSAKVGLVLDASGLSGGQSIQAVIDSTDFFAFNNSAVSIVATGSGGAHVTIARSTMANSGGAAIKTNGVNASVYLDADVITGSGTGVNIVGGSTVFTLANSQIAGNGINCAVGGVATACTSALTPQAQN